MALLAILGFGAQIHQSFRQGIGILFVLFQKMKGQAQSGFFFQYREAWQFHLQLPQQI
jgi:hypothetical protein